MRTLHTRPAAPARDRAHARPSGSAPARPRRWFLAAMLTPMTLTLLAFTLYPFLAVAWYGTHAADLTRPNEQGFTGVANFAAAMTGAGLARSVLLTALIVVVAVALEFVLGAASAGLLWRHLPGRRLFLPLLTLPFAATPIAAYLAWRLMLNPDGGQVNTLLTALGLPAPAWTASPALAVVSIVGVDVWQWTPFVTLVMLAGLQALPAEPFEAATLDGATGFERLWRLALPMLRPLVAFVLTFRAIDAVRTFDSIWVITGGGPGSATETLTVRIYRMAFTNLQIGEAAALSLLLLVVLVVAGRRFAAPALRRLEQ